MAKTNYEHVLDNLDVIEQLLLKGASDKSIYTTLGISKSAFYGYRYKKELAELYERVEQYKEIKARESMNELMELREIAGSKLKEKVNSGDDWAVKYVLDMFEEYTPYIKKANLELRIKEVDKNIETQQPIIIIKGAGEEPTE